MSNKLDNLIKRQLGQSGIEVSGMGLGCWAIGGPFFMDGEPRGWGNVDDNESIKAIQHALELGVTFIDTADVYGTGHSEKVVGKALKGKRQDVILASKFGYAFHAETRSITGRDISADYIRRACEDSLNRLQTDYIDLYQLHSGDQSAGVVDALEGLVREGKIRTYGWSTNSATDAARFLDGSHFSAVQAEINIFHDAPEMLEFCESNNLAAICRGPLAMGFLTGKFNSDSQLPKDDVRGVGFDWVECFTDGRPNPDYLKRLESIREVLTSNGRTLTQGALAWLWARSSQTIPIPGFRNIAQVDENAKAMQMGPLTADQMQEIETILGR
ncbi:MAG: aldo/keto reductase [Anaerolineae bacterium]